MAKRHFGRITVETSNEEKVLFPRDGIDKGDLIDYYEDVADRMLPWIAERPLVLQRFPDGVRKEGFYQKQVAEHFPDWIRTVRVGKAGGKSQELVICDNKSTLVYLANLACVTLHPWLCRTDRLDHPDQLVVDLDPSGHRFAPVRDAAIACRDLLAELGLPAFVKTTGSKGLHVVVPLDRRAGFDSVRDFARKAMELLAARHPHALTTEVRRNKRRGRVFLDVARNAYAQTAVAPYAVRPLPGAPVATPVAWSELGQVDARSFTVQNLRERLARDPDPWKGLRRHASGLSRARSRLERLRKDEAAWLTRSPRRCR
jgi:bifunctional non-homologous end joining protein LigD